MAVLSGYFFSVGATFFFVGADFYWEIVDGRHMIRGNGPTAVSSRLGYLLSGPITTQTTSTFTVNVTKGSINKYATQTKGSINKRAAQKLSDGKSMENTDYSKSTTITDNAQGIYENAHTKKCHVVRDIHGDVNWFDKSPT